jgi:hypothetical protein
MNPSRPTSEIDQLKSLALTDWVQLTFEIIADLSTVESIL